VTPEERAVNLQKFAEASVAAEHTTGCPAEVSCAQAILETGWGSHYFDNNVFGIKNTDRFPGTKYVFTKEYVNGTWQTVKLAFEVYPDINSCFVDHGTLVTGGFEPTRKNCYAPAYQHYLETGDVAKYVREIAVFYATDPGYADMVLTIMRQTDVIKAIEAARLKVVEDPAGA
jgi:flagellum-specific peptidoglycan hydrolase FlgJ